jgi:hypothetical protein
LTPFRPSRERAGPDPHLDKKLVIFALGAAFGLAGMLTGRRILIVAGIAILASGFLLRLLPPPRTDREDEEPSATDTDREP